MGKQIFSQFNQSVDIVSHNDGLVFCLFVCLFHEPIVAIFVLIFEKIIISCQGNRCFFFLLPKTKTKTKTNTKSIYRTEMTNYCLKKKHFHSRIFFLNQNPNLKMVSRVNKKCFHKHNKKNRNEFSYKETFWPRPCHFHKHFLFLFHHRIFVMSIIVDI